VGQIGKKYNTRKSQIVFQNSLPFLGRIGKASLSEFPEIFEQTISPKVLKTGMDIGYTDTTRVGLNKSA
jgi:hypothetical protein